MVLIVDLIK
jgi:hypothetical protein